MSQILKKTNLNIRYSKVVLTFYKSFKKSYDSKKVTGRNVTLNYNAEIMVELSLK